jgi:hypothetical protein
MCRCRESPYTQQHFERSYAAGHRWCRPERRIGGFAFPAGPKSCAAPPHQGNNAKILGKNGQVPERVSRKMNISRPGPTQRPRSAVLSSAGTSQQAANPRKWSMRYRRLEASSNAIYHTETGPPHSVPIVNRVAPQLPGLAEVVGRHARNHEWTTGVAQLKHLGVSPHLPSHRRQISNIADYLDASLICRSS